MSKTTPPGFRSFLHYLGRYKLRTSLVLLSFLVADIPLAIMPIFIGRLTGALAAHPVQGHTAVVLTWVLVILSTAHNIIWRVSELLYMRYLKPLGYLYENHLFERTINKPYPYFVDKFTGKMSSYITSISQELRDFIDNLAYNYVAQLVNIVALVIILASVNWQTGIIFIVGVTAMFLTGRWSIRNSTKYERIASDVQSTKNGKLIDAVANFVNVKSFRKELTELHTIESEQTKTIESAQKSFIWAIWFWTTMSFFVRDVIWPATIILNVYLFLHHEISISQLATLLSAILLFSTTIWESVWHVSQFNIKIARVEEAHSYLFGNTVIDTTAALRTPPPPLALRHQISLQNLHFAYPDKPDRPVLQKINLQLRKGEKIGVVGRSGSGKTTITKLLLGYFPTAAGTVLLDDTVVDNRDLAQLISYVPQDTSLFHRSISENIAYAAEQAVNHADIVRAAKRAHAHEFITQIDEGYEALVGERGVKLSAGQRQRIAIARAFLDDKPLLILDEATSALDSESEVLVQQALEALWQDKTVIAIAHRLSTLRHMDRIVVLDKGRIIEQGSHDELIKQGGQYAEFWNHQSGGFIDE